MAMAQPGEVTEVRPQREPSYSTRAGEGAAGSETVLRRKATRDPALTGRLPLQVFPFVDAESLQMPRQNTAKQKPLMMSSSSGAGSLRS